MDTAHQELKLFFKRVFENKLKEFSIKNNSQQLAHQPKFEMVCTKEYIFIEVDLVIKKNEWHYTLENNELLYNLGPASEEKTQDFIDYVRYCLEKRNENYVNVTEI